MTNATQSGEPTSTPASDADEERLLAAQVELIMAVPPLAIAVRFVEAVLDETERMIDQLPADVSVADIHGRWKSSNKLLRLYLRPASRRAVRLNELANRLAVAADLRFDPQD